jgi:hypothetical protein
MLRVLSTIAALLLGAVLLAAASPAAEKPFPQVVQLPTGFQPEGIEVGRGTTFYVGSVANGALFRGNLRTGKGASWLPAPPEKVPPASSSTIATVCG